MLSYYFLVFLDLYLNYHSIYWGTINIILSSPSHLEVGDGLNAARLLSWFSLFEITIGTHHHNATFTVLTIAQIMSWHVVYIGLYKWVTVVYSWYLGLSDY